MMIHNVYFWTVDGISDDEFAAFRGALDELVKIDLIQKSHIGRSAGTAEREGVTDHTFAANLTLFFASQADHDAYQVHPAHDVFVETCKHLWKRVTVYDTQLD